MLKAKMTLALMACPLLSASAVAPLPTVAGGAQCRSDELALFQCRIGRKRVAVCGSRSAPTVAYRFGTPNHIDMEYSSSKGPRSSMRYVYEMFSGGGEAQIGFANAGYKYTVYSSTQRTGFSGRNFPRFEAGVSVARNGKTVSRLKCVDDGSGAINTDLASSLLGKGTFNWDR